MPNRDNLREERFISATGFRVISVCSGEGKPVGREAMDVHIKGIQKQRLQMEPRYNFKSTYSYLPDSILKSHDGLQESAVNWGTNIENKPVENASDHNDTLNEALSPHFPVVFRLFSA